MNVITVQSGVYSFVLGFRFHVRTLRDANHGGEHSGRFPRNRQKRLKRWISEFRVSRLICFVQCSAGRWPEIAYGEDQRSSSQQDVRLCADVSMLANRY